MQDLTLLQARVNAAKSRRGRKLLAIMSAAESTGKDEDSAVLDSILNDALVVGENGAVQDVQTGAQAGAQRMHWHHRHHRHHWCAFCYVRLGCGLTLMRYELQASLAPSTSRARPGMEAACSSFPRMKASSPSVYCVRRAFVVQHRHHVHVPHKHHIHVPHNHHVRPLKEPHKHHIHVPHNHQVRPLQEPTNCGNPHLPQSPNMQILKAPLSRIATLRVDATHT